ncbi:facilitated trehalose transporter Tret1-like isoform X3 [Atheta coriaria]|uniref:facilitated trehalose transporter Tret1-like isoform X3 n=1 Tax=Dalotia coriaria TaxID=877792 RepID=UPI0031F427EE
MSINPTYTAYPEDFIDNPHSRLEATASASVSASTTATNLSEMDHPIQPMRKPGTRLDENCKKEFQHLNPDSNKQDIEDPPMGCEDIRKKYYLRIQVLTAISVSLVSLVIGYVSAYTAPAAESLQAELELTKNEWSWVCSLMPLSALVGGLVGGQLIDYFGRKRIIAFTNCMYIASWLLCANATNVWYVYAARTVVGFSVGIASLVLPVYLGETIQPEVRGTLGLLPSAFGNTGILVCFAAGSYLKWDHLAWVGFALPLPFLLIYFQIPESPRWYILKERNEEARQALQYLRGKDCDISNEFDDLVRSHKESEKLSSSSSLTDLFTKSNMRPLAISLGLMFFQQMSGINAVIFYTTTIFKMAGSSIDENVCTIIVGLVNFVSTFLATILIDRLGRKVLLYISSVSMIMTLSVLGSYFYLRNVNVDVSDYGWLPLLSFVIYVLGFSLGFGPIPWLMLGEILPAKIRGSAASIATAFNWSCTFIVTKIFLNIIELVGTHGTFWLFSLFVLGSLVFIYLWVPETRGKSLEDIERKFARRMSSVANLKPLPSSAC